MRRKQLKKWDEFRQNRTEIIIKFIELKKRSKALEMLLHQRVLHNYIKLIFERITEEKRLRKMRGHGARLSLMMFIKLGRKIKKKGGIDRITKDKIRNNFTFNALIMNDAVYR